MKISRFDFAAALILSTALLGLSADDQSRGTDGGRRGGQNGAVAHRYDVVPR